MFRGRKGQLTAYQSEKETERKKTRGRKDFARTSVTKPLFLAFQRFSGRMTVLAKNSSKDHQPRPTPVDTASNFRDSITEENTDEIATEQKRSFTAANKLNVVMETMVERKPEGTKVRVTHRHTSWGCV